VSILSIFLLKLFSLSQCLYEEIVYFPVSPVSQGCKDDIRC
jgi:hypothetical protein